MLSFVASRCLHCGRRLLNKDRTRFRNRFARSLVRVGHVHHVGYSSAQTIIAAFCSTYCNTLHIPHPSPGCNTSGCWGEVYDQPAIAPKED